MLPKSFYENWNKSISNNKDETFIKLFLEELKKYNLVHLNNFIENFENKKAIIKLRTLINIECYKTDKLRIFFMKYPQFFKIDSLDKLSLQTKAGDELDFELINTFDLRCITFIKLRLNFFGFYKVPINLIHQNFYVAAHDIKYFFKYYKNLLNFLFKYSQHFIVENKYVILKSVNEVRLTKNLNIPKLDVLDIDEKLFSKTFFIINLENGINVIDYILKNVKVVAYDSEGIDLGSINSKITLVQIAFVSPFRDVYDENYIIENTKVYLFDILACPDLMKNCIEKLLSSNRVLKVIHGYKTDSHALKNEFNINVENVFDSNKAYLELHLETGRSGLYSIYEQFTGISTNLLKNKMKKMYYQYPPVWARRPLNNFFIYYAALDAFALLRVYYIMIDKYIKKDYKKYIF